MGFEIIINKCTQYEIKDRYQSCAELRYDLENPEALGMPYRSKLKKKMAAFCVCAGTAAFLGIGAVLGTVTENLIQKRGYDFYIDEASVASLDEKLELYKKAIALNPVKKDAYLSILDTMLADNDFSAADDMTLTSILNSRDNRRNQNNKTYFQTNKSGYVEFSYQLGLAYYYLTGDNGDKASAAGWFYNVTSADMSALDLGDNNDNKGKWQTRAKVLGKISSYYKSKLGVINQMGDAEVSYLDYWNDLMALMAEDVADKDNRITELRLYSEITYQIYRRTTEFKNEAGLSEDEQNAALTEISVRLAQMDTGGNPLAEQLVNEITENIRLAKKNVAAAYSANT